MQHEVPDHINNHNGCAYRDHAVDQAHGNVQHIGALGRSSLSKQPAAAGEKHQECAGKHIDHKGQDLLGLLPEKGGGCVDGEMAVFLGAEDRAGHDHNEEHIPADLIRPVGIDMQERAANDLIDDQKEECCRTGSAYDAGDNVDDLKEYLQCVFHRIAYFPMISRICAMVLGSTEVDR